MTPAAEIAEIGQKLFEALCWTGLILLIISMGALLVKILSMRR